GRAGTANDDPWTSPSSARPTPASRSYGSARRNGQADTDSTHDGSPAAAGYGGTGYPDGGYGNSDYANGRPDDRTPVNGAYQVPDYPDPGYAYVPAAPQAPSAAATQPDDWYNAPPQATP